MDNIRQIINERREYFILALMLELLHFSIWIDILNPFSRALVLIHLGLFLIWQPIQRSEVRYSWQYSIIFILLTLAFVYWINWWLIFVWLILLIGIVGGRVVTSQIERNVYLLVMLVLVMELMIFVVPRLFGITEQFLAGLLHKYSGALIPLLLPIFPHSTGQQTVLSVDILHAITASLLASLLSLGTLVIMFHTGTNYISALTQSLLAIGLCLFGISWILSPHAGFSGLSQVWSRSLLNIGTPFEKWLSELSKLTQAHESASGFLQAALEKLVTLPWVAGVILQMVNNSVKFGETTRHEIKQSIGGNPVSLYTKVPTGGALLLHCNLLIQLIEYLYLAKINEQELAKRAHLQAIYETGARITHDIKNLLQSMHSMINILQADNDEPGSKSILILKKQFPFFIQRLEQAMNKLQAPKDIKSADIYLKDWWRDLQVRYRENNIRFKTEITGDPRIPYDLFESVAENLLENATSKRKNEPGIEITAISVADESNICFAVHDTGSAIVEKTAGLLFKEPIRSDNGLGIGLLQAAKQATNLGYTLYLKQNQPGNVCIAMEKLLTGKQSGK